MSDQDHLPASAAPEVVLCGNDEHKPRIAAYRVTWPSKRFNPTTACRSCAAVLVRNGAIEAGGVTFEVIP
jgi:hypothetical protein